ncbi:MAG: terminase gpA endonuclease subunit [Polynucleobacter sp.]
MNAPLSVSALLAVDRDLFRLPTRSVLTCTKDYRAFWSSQHTVTFLRMQSGRLYPRNQLEGIATGLFRGMSDFLDALPDMVADRFDRPELIDILVARVDAFRRTMVDDVVAALVDAEYAEGYGREVEFFDDTGGRVDVFEGVADDMTMHVDSPVVDAGSMPTLARWFACQVYGNPFEAMRTVAQDTLTPPDRASVADVARRYMRVSIPGGFSGAYDPSLTPYFDEPMADMTDRRIEMIVFAGPAQTGKTAALIDAAAVHAIIADPTDLTIVQPSQSSANDYATRRLDRIISQSPELQARQLPSPGLLRKFTAGQLVGVAWPSINTLSGKSIPRMLLTDFDRMTLDLEGEGSPLDLARARTRTFRSRAKVIVESSPGFEVDRDAEPPVGEHAAPSAPGILGAYNAGSMGRWFTLCQHCGEPFKFENDRLTYPQNATPEVAGHAAAVVCPECGGLHTHEQKRDLNACGFWVHAKPDATVKSYWLHGVAATWATWEAIVRNLLAARKHRDETGDATRLKSVVNVDFGEPYTPDDQVSTLEVAADYRARADNELAPRQPPILSGVVTTAVDVQARRFVIQVHAWGMGGESWIIDRFNLSKSQRMQPDSSYAPIAPGVHAEDWAVLDSLLDREYQDANGRVLKTSIVVIDTGGTDSMTANAYAYWRRARTLGINDRVHLVRGFATRYNMRTPPARVQLSQADGNPRSKGRKSGAVPFWVVNTNALKDEVTAHMARGEPGPNTLHLPAWAGDWFFAELAAEERTAKGWAKRRAKANNEALDLCVYSRAAFIILGGENGKLDASMPRPAWADERDVYHAPPQQTAVQRSFGDLARRLNPT